MAQAPSESGLLSCPRAEFREKLNAHAFAFSHGLASHALFSIDRIERVARDLIESGRKDRFGALDFRSASIDSKFSKMPDQERLAETVRSLGTTGSWIKLTGIEEFDLGYRTILSQVTAQIDEMAGYPFARDVSLASMTLFLSSPNISTPFHIDHESNFLLQIAGDKQVALFDQRDREMVPYTAIESFYGGNFEAAALSEQHNRRATIYELKPGRGVHHPPLAPHWVKTKGDVSISLSIWYCLKSFDAQARLHQANFLLRNLGLEPARPGVRPKLDRLKAKSLSLLEYRKPTSHKEIVFGPMIKIKAPIKKVLTMLGASERR